MYELSVAQELRILQAEQRGLAEKIAKLEAQTAKKPTEVCHAGYCFFLNPREHYAGIIIGKDGERSYHLILLADQAEDLTWDNAKEWAVKAGGDLPTRREQALLYANLNEQFEGSWYWSSEQHASVSHYAWYQYFYDGIQGLNLKSAELRARAVRRIPI